jgi:hypothetical protein
MLEELFKKAVQLGMRIAAQDVARFGELLERARELWTEYGPRHDPRTRVVMGVDSGWNVRLYEGFYVYALRAAAVDENQEVHEPVAEFDMIGGEQTGLTPENYVKVQGEMAEHYVADRVADEADLVLVDGSLIARLQSAHRLLRELHLLNEYLSLARSLRERRNVVFVAKYSHRRSLIRGELGDIYYIARSMRTPGYVLGQTDERFGIPITTAYIRLANDAQPLAIEVPSGDVGEEDVRHIMDVLSSRSVMGYPYALYLAHRVVSVSEALMDQLCRTAGLIAFREAREVLEL